MATTDSGNSATTVNPECEQWRAGYKYGYADNHIAAWQYRYYTHDFLRGWRAGKAEIDQMIDDAAQARVW